MTSGFLRALRARALRQEVVATVSASGGVIIAATHLPSLMSLSELAQDCACRANHSTDRRECQTRMQGNPNARDRATPRVSPEASNKKWWCRRWCVVTHSRVQGWTSRLDGRCFKILFMLSRARTVGRSPLSMIGRGSSPTPRTCTNVVLGDSPRLLISVRRSMLAPECRSNSRAATTRLKCFRTNFEGGTRSRHAKQL